MLSAPQIIREAESLPVDERAQIVDSLLRSLNQTVPEIDQLWVTASQSRLDALRSGMVRSIGIEAVLDRLQDRFPK